MTTTTASATATPSATETPVNTDSTGAASRMAVDMGHVYGLCVVVGGFVAGFATLL